MNTERYRLAAQLRAEGKTLQQVGDALGVCKERARMMIKTAHRLRISESEDWYFGLSNRTTNALRYHGFSSRAGIEKVARDGLLVVGQFHSLGQKSINEIVAWLNSKP